MVRLMTQASEFQPYRPRRFTQSDRRADTGVDTALSQACRVRPDRIVHHASLSSSGAATDRLFVRARQYAGRRAADRNSLSGRKEPGRIQLTSAIAESFAALRRKTLAGYGLRKALYRNLSGNSRRTGMPVERERGRSFGQQPAEVVPRPTSAGARPLSLSGLSGKGENR